MPEALPKPLPGTVCVQWVRCRRTGCRCRTGKLHGPYYYRFWREGGRLRKAYVKRADLEQVRAQCQAHRRHRKPSAEGVAPSLALWRLLLAQVKEVEQACPR